MFYKEKESYSFTLPIKIEEEIFKNISTTTKFEESFLFTDLLNSGMWVEISPPKNYNEWKALEGSLNEWNIADTDGIKVKLYKSQSIDKYNFNTLTVSDGLFLSVYTGESGGALYFYPNSDKNKKYKVKDGYIWQLYEIGDENYALEAFPFSNPQNGKILKLKKKFSKWISQEIIDINDIPYCTINVGDNTMYLVTYNKLIKLVNNKISEVIIDNAFWKGLYPNSALYKDGYIYIGMRAGIAKVDIKSKEIHFYTPKI